MQPIHKNEHAALWCRRERIAMIVSYNGVY